MQRMQCRRRYLSGEEEGGCHNFVKIRSASASAASAGDSR
jgi:hypothetical protein